MRLGIETSSARDLALTNAQRGEVVHAWLAARPLVLPVGGFIAGIALDAWLGVPITIALIFFLAAGGGLWLSRGRFGVSIGYAAVFVAAAMVGGLRHDLCYDRWPADHIVLHVRPEGTPVRLTGRVLGTPRLAPRRMGMVQWLRDVPRTKMLVEAETIEGVAEPIDVTGTVAVTVRQPVLEAQAGDRVECFGTLYAYDPPGNPGEHDFARSSRRRGVLVGMSCKLAPNVRVTGTADRRARWLERVREYAKLALIDRMYRGDEPGAELLTAMVLGQRSAVSDQLNESFAAAGTIHYLSVSGAHVGMLASAVWLLTAAVGANRRVGATWVLIAITLYGLLAEPRPPILRAVLVGDLFCIAVLMRRRVHSLNLLAAAAIVLLVLRPTQLFEAGFQLSFVTVLTILYVCPRVHAVGVNVYERLSGRDDPLLSPRMQQRLGMVTPVQRGWQWAASIAGWAVALTCSAWLVSLLLAAYFFHRVSLWGWLNNLFVLPLVWVVQLLGLLKTVVGILLPAAGQWLAWPLAGASEALIALVEFLASWPGAGLSVPAPPAWLVAAGLAVLLLWVVAPHLAIHRRWVGLAAMAFAVMAASRMAPARSAGTVKIHLLAVGNGTCCVIQLPDGRNVLYDVGSLPPYDIERWTLGPFLSEQGIYGFDAAIVSHANIDHFCGLPDVLHHWPVRTVVAPPHFAIEAATQWSARRVIDLTEAQGVPWRVAGQGDRFGSTGEVTIDVLWPPAPNAMPIPSANDTSLVLRVSYEGHRILLCGDIEALPQYTLMEQQDLKADVLVLPHHGSVEHSTAAFVEAVNPGYCLRSSGRRDADTHNGLLAILGDRAYCNTADDGAITVRMDGSGVEVRGYRRRPACATGTAASARSR